MGRPKLPENEKKRSFPVRLAMKSTGRIFGLVSRQTGRTAQDLFREILDREAFRLYNEARRRDPMLPDYPQLIRMDDKAYEQLLSDASPQAIAARGRPRLIRREPAHV